MLLITPGDNIGCIYDFLSETLFREKTSERPQIACDTACLVENHLWGAVRPWYASQTHLTLRSVERLSEVCDTEMLKYVARVDGFKIDGIHEIPWKLGNSYGLP